VRSITSRATALLQSTGAMTTPFQSDAADCELERIQLDELVERFRHRVRYFVRRVEVRFGLDPQWHDDLISAGYWGLFKALRNRRPDAHERELSAYVSQRVEGAVIDEARRALSQVSNQSDLDPLDPDSEVVFAKTQLGWHQGAERAGPEDQADRHGRWRTIEASVEHLADDQRDLLWAYAAGGSISEIARKGGLPPARLQSQMSRISRQLRARSPGLRRLLRCEI